MAHWDTVRLCGQDVKRPGHICAFFDSRETEYEMLIPYFKEGVDRGEDVLTVIDADRLDDHLARLERAGMHPDLGRVVVASCESTYLTADGHFDMERMAAFVEDTVATSNAQGRRVRTAGWMGWLQAGAPGSERAMEYESRMNLLVSRYDCTFMCVYDVAQLGGPEIIEVMATHPWMILNGKISRNAKYVPPEIYLEELLSGKRPPRSVA